MFSEWLVFALPFACIARVEAQPKSDDEHVRLQRDIRCARQRYRQIDGSCNNVDNPSWGRTGTPYARFLAPDYAEGQGEMRRGMTRDELPSARIVSLHMVRDVNNEHPVGSHMVMQWGQLINHDITKKRTREVSCCDDGMTASTDNRECRPILLPSDDPFFRKRCLSFSRSDFVNVNGKREQINDVTGFVDASPVYGSTESIARSLRRFNGGRLKSLPRTVGKHLLPTMASDSNSFSSGDSRTNMIPSLVIAHVLLLREHNRVAEHLEQLNPRWNDETLYQEARKIVSALVQKITYGEYLPTVMGSDNMRSLSLLDDGYFGGYDPTLNPAIGNGFAVAAYRFGHSLVQSQLKRFTPDLREIPAPPLALEFFNVSSILNRDGEVDRIVLGLINQHTQQADSSFSSEIQNNLFGTSGTGSDLYAINIQRGRDHGVPGYNAWRRFCGFPTFRDFSELSNVMSADAANTLRRLYSNVDDIDLYAAGMAEVAVPGGLVGPTFGCIVARQFQNLRHGDRYWFENGDQTGSFTPEQLREIRKATLARLICDNTDLIDRMQLQAMHVPAERNQLIPCENIPGIDLRFWQENGRQRPNQGFSGQNNVHFNDNGQGRPQQLSPPQSTRVTFPPNFPFHNTAPPSQTAPPFQNNLIVHREPNFPVSLIRNQERPHRPARPTQVPSPPTGENFPIRQKLAESSSPPHRFNIHRVPSRPFQQNQQENVILEPTVGPLSPGSVVFIPPKEKPPSSQNKFGPVLNDFTPVQNELRNISRFDALPNRGNDPSRAQFNNFRQQTFASSGNAHRNPVGVQPTGSRNFANRNQESNFARSPLRPSPSPGNQQRKPTTFHNTMESLGLPQSSKPVHIFFTQGGARAPQSFTRLKTLNPQPGVVLRVPGLSHVNEDEDAFGYFVTF